MLKILIFLLLIQLPNFNLFAQTEKPLILGIPESRVTTTPKSTKREIFATPEQGAESFMSISASPNGYVWSSRNNDPLFYKRSGLYDIYTSATGSGYVKIRNDVVTCDYMEHVHLELMTLEYHGDCASPQQIKN